ncbi:MAG: amino acid ABC transporter ATP-binding protein [Desulfobacter sp.]|nr:MAG: amino acid ABC transporter ATP-binding protein [Desulfobacter sp.]
MNHSDYAISVDNLHKSFGPLEVLKGINFAAKKGEVICLLGSSGSGKSTLLRSINLLEIPQQGDVYIAGELIRMQGEGDKRRAGDKAQINRIRAKLGMVFQNFNLWTHMTILQNVMEGQVQVLGRTKVEARDTALKYLVKVGVADKADAYPSQLSGGQQQRVAIARALAMDPALLLFDEPTSALDPELVQEVLQVMRALAAEGRTMLIVTHEMEFAREVSSRIVFLDAGEITEDGPPETVFTHPATDRFRQFITMNPSALN